VTLKTCNRCGVKFVKLPFQEYKEIQIGGSKNKSRGFMLQANINSPETQWIQHFSVHWARLWRAVVA
jgi:hypothetical protein